MSSPNTCRVTLRRNGLPKTIPFVGGASSIPEIQDVSETHPVQSAAHIVGYLDAVTAVDGFTLANVVGDQLSCTSDCRCLGAIKTRKFEPFTVESIDFGKHVEVKTRQFASSEKSTALNNTLARRYKVDQRTLLSSIARKRTPLQTNYIRDQAVRPSYAHRGTLVTIDAIA